MVKICLEVITANLEFFTMEGYNSKTKVCFFFSPSYEKNTSKKQFKESFDFGSRFEEIHLIIAGR